MNQKAFELAATNEAYVDLAAGWARKLVQHESHGPGDTNNALRRLSARYHISYSTLWALRYRKPKEMVVSVFTRIQAAYLAECQRQLKRLEHEIEITRAVAGPDCDAVRSAEAVLDAVRREVRGVPEAGAAPMTD